MEAEEMQIGMKVKPLQRTIKGEIKPAEHSLVYRQALSQGQKFLYVSHINFDTVSGVPRIMCSLTPGQGGDCFDDTDLVPYKGGTMIPFEEGKEIREINERLEFEAEFKFGGMWPDQS